MPRLERQARERKAMQDPAYHANRIEYLRQRRRNKGAKPMRYTNDATIRSGYYAPVDRLGRLLCCDGLPVTMTYSELYERARGGWLSPGLLLEQADLRGCTIATYRLEIQEGKMELMRLETER